MNHEHTVYQMIELPSQESPEARVEVTARRGKYERCGSIIVECVVYDDHQGTRAAAARDRGRGVKRLRDIVGADGSECTHPGGAGPESGERGRGG